MSKWGRRAKKAWIFSGGLKNPHRHAIIKRNIATTKKEASMTQEKQKMKEARAWIQAELAGCIDFWLKNGIDHVHGGVYTC